VTTRYALDGQSVVQEWKPEPGGGSDWVTYLTGAQSPLCRREDHEDSSGNVIANQTSSRWYVYDGLGSVIGEVDDTGDLKSSWLCDVYGAARTAWKESGETVSRHQFVGALGHMSENETGLIYMRARFMDAETGRFVSEDPAGVGPDWYVYACNSPVNLVDESGKVASTLASWEYLTAGWTIAFWAGIISAASSNKAVLAACTAGLAWGMALMMIGAIGHGGQMADIAHELEGAAVESIGVYASFKVAQVKGEEVGGRVEWWIAVGAAAAQAAEITVWLCISDHPEAGGGHVPE
jgi:RHS repeat-associated protein